MRADPQRVLSAARRTDFSSFMVKAFETLHPGAPPLRRVWYLKAICHALSEVRAGRTKRLVINVPPRHLKSISVAVAYVAWLLGHNPAMKIMVASYSHDLARLHSNQTRTIMKSAWYKADFPGTRIKANRALEIETTAEGGRKGVSVGGSTTGFGAHMIIVDDVMKASDARSAAVREDTKFWFDETLVARLEDKANNPIISIQQRLHEDDLPAYLLAKGFAHLCLPAIAEKEERVPIGKGLFHERCVGDLLDPERESRATLDQLRRELGNVVFHAGAVKGMAAALARR